MKAIVILIYPTHEYYLVDHCLIAQEAHCVGCFLSSNLNIKRRYHMTKDENIVLTDISIT